MRVGFLGPKGSFTHNVGVKVLPKADLVAFETITEVIKAYELGQVDLSIVPVENAIEGSVHETLDYLFHQANLHAVAEIIQPIKQQLLATSVTKEIEKIFSHPQAVAQGKKFILEHYPNATIELTASTAFAARFVADHPEANYAAIAPHEAANTYGLTVIAKDIHEMAKNYTRFWLLGQAVPAISRKTEERRISLALTLPDNLPGALHKALSVFAWRGIDLTKLESRPLKTALGEYFFILEAKHDQADLVAFALEELETMGIRYKILGKYEVFQMENLEE